MGRISRFSFLAFLTVFLEMSPVGSSAAEVTPTTSPQQLVQSTGSGPSFDCAAARSVDERLICSDQALGEADGALAKVFREYRDSLDLSHREEVIRGQRAWIIYRNQACGITRNTLVNGSNCPQLVECLLHQYQTRTNELTSLANAAAKQSAQVSPPSTPAPITQPQGPSPNQSTSGSESNPSLQATINESPQATPNQGVTSSQSNPSPQGPVNGSPQVTSDQSAPSSQGADQAVAKENSLTFFDWLAVVSIIGMLVGAIVGSVNIMRNRGKVTSSTAKEANGKMDFCRVACSIAYCLRNDPKPEQSAQGGNEERAQQEPQQQEGNSAEPGIARIEKLGKQPAGSVQAKNGESFHVRGGNGKDLPYSTATVWRDKIIVHPAANSAEAEEEAAGGPRLYLYIGEFNGRCADMGFGIVDFDEKIPLSEIGKRAQSAKNFVQTTSGSACMTNNTLIIKGQAVIEYFGDAAERLREADRELRRIGDVTHTACRQGSYGGCITDAPSTFDIVITPNAPSAGGFMRTIFMLLSSVLFFVGLIALVKPLPRFYILTRKRAGLVILAGLLVAGIASALFPPPNATSHPEAMSPQERDLRVAISPPDFSDTLAVQESIQSMINILPAGSFGNCNAALMKLEEPNDNDRIMQAATNQALWSNCAASFHSATGR